MAADQLNFLVEKVDSLALDNKYLSHHVDELSRKPVRLEPPKVEPPMILSSPSKLLLESRVNLSDSQLIEIQFDLQQLNEQCRLKNESCKNLQNQLA